MRQFVEVFRESEIVVSPSASCVGMVRDLYPRAAELAGDPALAEAVALLTPRVFELTEFLVQKLGLDDVSLLPPRVTYHPTCHSLRMLHVGDAPSSTAPPPVRGIDLITLPRAEECCGFGGTFAVKNADTSMAMLGDKLRCVLDTRAEYCVASDNSCLMHIGGALHRQRAGVGILHIAEILAATEKEGHR